MRIVVANINTTENITRAIHEQALGAAGPDTEILPVTPTFGPASVEGNFEGHLAAVGVIDRIIAIEEPFDALVVAGFGGHGREGLTELLDVPVVDITEAGVQLACLLGRSYSVVTSLHRTVGQIRDRLRLAGLDGRCASVRSVGMSVLELERDTARIGRHIVQEAAQAVDRDGAGVVCLGCAGLVGLAEQVQDEVGVPVVEPVAAGVGLTETLVDLRLRPSTIGSYSTPQRKDIAGWPLTRS
ncbi:Asp/Glu/hydantoin racemase [Allosaccharopolyspora coralli]|uniref:Hydantoin racemase n=1 Tax=Allosaccharopolyspora coralli TaxID=2665642 RepID=A0A5Q3Q6H2_9PSEU|nr:aspartate/glutamate racemase family protein [Allosaccharopolyspora coralli]QGK68774.1 Asp/Glu/hydantoin racemase [Allosaccharopolyspora coralli]